MTALRIALPLAPATETHCGDKTGVCVAGFRPPHCCAFNGVREYDQDAGAYKRLPKCISAQLESEWTEQRPTEAGEYELSIAPEKRRGFPAVIECEVAFWAVDMDGAGKGLRIKYKSGGAWLELLGNEWFEGARWRKREQPADPFAGGE